MTDDRKISTAAAIEASYDVSMRKETRSLGEPATNQPPPEVPPRPEQDPAQLSERAPTPIEREAEDTKAEADARALERESHDRRET